MNDVLRTVTGCLRPTLADSLSVLPGIQPADLRRKGITLFLARRAMVPGHLLHSTLTCPSSANTRHFKSRRPFAMPHNNSSAYLTTTTTEVRCSGGSPLEGGVIGEHYDILYFVLSYPTPAPTLPDWL